MSGLPKARVQLLDNTTGQVVSDVDILTSTDWVSYSNPNQTIRDFRGIVKGSSFNNESVASILNSLLYPYEAPDIKYIYGTASDISSYIYADKTVIKRRYSTINSFVLFANIEVGSEKDLNVLFKTMDESMNKVLQTQINVKVEAGSTYVASFNVDSISATSSIQITVSDGKNTVESPVISFKFVDPVFIGYCDFSRISTSSLLDLSKLAPYFDELISCNSAYLDTRVTYKEDQTSIILSDPRYANLAMYPCILYPQEWGNLSSIIDVNGNNITSNYTSCTANITPNSNHQDTTPYRCYISKIPYDVQLPVVGQIKYLFNSTSSIHHDGSGVPTLSGLDVLATVPVDMRTVVNYYNELFNIIYPYDGLVVYVKHDKAFFKYEESSKTWQPTNQQVFLVMDRPTTSLGAPNDIAIDLKSGLFWKRNIRNEWVQAGRISGNVTVTEYDGTETYNPGDIVSYADKNWQALTTVRGVVPSEDKSKWMEVAIGGATAIGPKGDPGESATIEIVDTATGAPGSSVKVENIGTTSHAKLKFTLPSGKNATIKVGKVQQGSTFKVTNVGTETNAILDFEYPATVSDVTGSIQNDDGSGAKIRLSFVKEV